MHSANRAKQRHHQKVVENDFTKKQQVDHHPSSNKPFNNHNNNNNHHVKRDVQIAFGSRIWDERSHHVTNGTPSRRSKSLDRKSNLRKHQIREQSTGKSLIFVALFIPVDCGGSKRLQFELVLKGVNDFIC